MGDLKIVKLIDPTAIVTGGLVPKGAYDSGTSYSIGDSVSYNGSSYVCIANTTGNLPTNTTYWQVLADKGSTGATGPTGATGATGAAGTNGTDGADGLMTSVVAGTHISVDSTDPANPVVSTSGLGTLATLNSIDLTANVGSTILPIANGGTGSASQNFVDLSSTQSSIGGAKTFTGQTTFENNSYPTVSLYRGANATTAGASFNLYTSQGTYQSPTALASNFALGSMVFNGYDGSVYQNTAQVVALTDGSVSSGVLPARISFFTSTTNGAGLTERWRITSGGNLTPAANNTYNVGSSSNYASNLYATTLNLNSTASIGGGTAGTVAISANNANFAFNSTGQLIITDGGNGFTGGNGLLIRSTSTVTEKDVGFTLMAHNGANQWQFSARDTNQGDGSLFAFYNNNGISWSGAILTLHRSGQVDLIDGGNLVLGTTSGTQIGTSSTQKVAFYAATPVVQPSTTGTTSGFTVGSGTAMNSASTSTGNTGTLAYTFGDVVLALKQLGLLKG